MLRVGGESRAGSFYIRGVAVTSRVQRGAMRGWGLLCGIALSLLLQPPPCCECGDIGMGTGGAGGTSAFRCMSRGEDGTGMGGGISSCSPPPSFSFSVLVLSPSPPVPYSQARRLVAPSRSPPCWCRAGTCCGAPAESRWVGCGAAGLG